jgi:hypothetical protein
LNIFVNKLIFYGEELLAPRLTPKLEGHPLSAVCNCLFNIFTVSLHTWRASPPSAYSTNGGEEEIYRILLRKPDGKRSLGRPIE